MNPKHLILPIIALAIAGIMVGTQRKKATELRSEIRELQKHITVATTSPSNPTNPTQSDPIDWEKLAATIQNNPSSQSPNLLSIQRRLLTMDAAELLAALDHIATMDLDEVTRMRLEYTILDPLCRCDPEAALQRFKGRLREPHGIHTFFLSQALKEWAKRDLAPATAWLDREIETGTFEPKKLDGNDSLRSRFESAVVFGMLASSPALAETRLAKLPAYMRAEILRQADTFHPMKHEDEIAYAAIVRRQLDETGRVAAIGDRAQRVILKGGDFAAVNTYLNSVHAAPDERAQAADAAASQRNVYLAAEGKLSPAEIDAMRAWASRDAPAAVDRLTGEALAEALSGGKSMNFEEASALALRYQETSGNDQVLQAFLSNIPANANQPTARKLAEKITDPEKRENLLKKFK